MKPANHHDPDHLDLTSLEAVHRLLDQLESASADDLRSVVGFDTIEDLAAALSPARVPVPRSPDQRTLPAGSELPRRKPRLSSRWR
jgi:hypothetical protein